MKQVSFPRIKQGLNVERVVVIKITLVPLRPLLATAEEKIVPHYVVGDVKRIRLVRSADSEGREGIRSQFQRSLITARYYGGGKWVGHIREIMWKNEKVVFRENI